VPASYEYQGLHYSAVTGIPKTVFCALLGGEGLVVREREWSATQIKNLIELEAEFWEMVQTDKAPDVEGKASDFDTLKALYPSHVIGCVVEVDEFQADLVSEYQRAKKFADEAQQVADKVKAQLLTIIADAEEVQYDGKTLFTYKASRDGETFDAKLFKEQNPDMARIYTKVRPGFRTLRIKETN
jgi:predicted phage-related endonuclease